MANTQHIIDGSRRSIAETIKIFDEFAVFSDFKISPQKSTIFLAGVSEENKDELLAKFPFAKGDLPVRYLGLPLLSKRMTTTDYGMLVDRIRTRLRSWTGRHDTYHMQEDYNCCNRLSKGLVNFWIQEFRLPNQCIIKIESLCAVFLWSGPSLNTRKSKVAWRDVCKPEKGGLGFKSLKEANVVSCLKLI